MNREQLRKAAKEARLDDKILKKAKDFARSEGYRNGCAVTKGVFSVVMNRLKIPKDTIKAIMDDVESYKSLGGGT